MTLQLKKCLTHWIFSFNVQLFHPKEATKTNDSMMREISLTGNASMNKKSTTHDLTFLHGGKKGESKHLRRSSLYFHVPENVGLVGNSAYEDQSDKVSITRDTQKPTTKHLFGWTKSMLETRFKRSKDFKILHMERAPLISCKR